MPDQTALSRAFVAEAKRLLEEHPGIAHTWTIDPDHQSCTLNIPKLDEQGFDITIEIDSDDLWVNCGRFQASDCLEEGTAEDFAGHCVGLLYDLLTPLMRVREQLAGEVPYRWTLECLRGDTWESRGSHSRFFFNFWGKRSERIYRNHTLPRRDHPLNT
jgi:hypothetical protein